MRLISSAGIKDKMINCKLSVYDFEKKCFMHFLFVIDFFSRFLKSYHKLVIQSDTIFKKGTILIDHVLDMSNLVHLIVRKNFMVFLHQTNFHL